MKRNMALEKFFIGIIIFLIFSLSAGMIFPIFAIDNKEEEKIEIVTDSITPTEEYKKIQIEDTFITVKNILQKHLKLFKYEKPKNKEEAQLKAEEVFNYIENIYKILPPQHKTDLYVKAYNFVSFNINYSYNIYNQYKKDYIELTNAEKIAKWNKKAAEYPEATKVWLYMKNVLGWNDYVCAGVLGNMMAECGGQTLNLNPYLYDAKTGFKFYGICQWHYKYYGEIHNASLTSQLNYLKSNVEYEIDTFGYLFYQGFNYKSFTNIKDCEEAALAFAVTYERCHSEYYEIRQQNALKAYSYFVN